VLGIHAGRDDRMDAARDRATAALGRAGPVHEAAPFEGADQAFFDDTGPRYAAADDAWTALPTGFPPAPRVAAPSARRHPLRRHRR